MIQIVVAKPYFLERGLNMLKAKSKAIYLMVLNTLWKLIGGLKPP